MQSSDSVQAATGSMLAALLGLPQVAVVTKLEYDHAAKRATVRRELEGGLIDVVEVDTPALLTIQTGINEPRYATLRAIKQANQQEIAVLEAVTEGEPAYRVRRMFVPPAARGPNRSATRRRTSLRVSPRSSRRGCHERGPDRRRAPAGKAP